MDYFLFKQDERYVQIPRLVGVRGKVDIRDVCRARAERIPNRMTFRVDMEVGARFLHVHDYPFYVVTEEIKQIMGAYEPEALFKQVLLIDAKGQQQLMYYMPIFEEVEALGASSTFNLDKSVITKLTLDGRRIRGKCIFQIQESLRPLLAVRLDVAESLLRREFVGMKLVRAEVE